jgi:hypothetical protein
LADDSPKGCPFSMAAINKYLNAESGGVRPDLFFGRTALVGDVRFWLWAYIDGGKTYFVDVSERAGRSTVCIGSGEGLSPEQYIALRYARRWKGRAE